MSAVRLAFRAYEPNIAVDPRRCPVIMTHGFLLNKSFFKKPAQPLADSTKRKVYCVDLRGHGESPCTEENSCYLMADDIYLFLEEHNIKKASFVAHSLSSRAVTLFAIANPQAVEKIVVIDFSPFSEAEEKLVEFCNAVKPVMQEIFESANSNGSRDEVKLEMQYKFSQNKKTASVNRFLELILDNEVRTDKITQVGGNFDVLLRCFSQGSFRIFPLGSYDGEILFMKAEQSAFIKDYSQVRIHFSKAEFMVMKDTTHLLPIEKPLQFVDEVCKFLKR